MADFDDAAVVRELASTEIGRMTNAQLKRALTAVLGAEKVQQNPLMPCCWKSYVLCEKSWHT